MHFSYPGIFPPSFGIYVFERDASTAGVSFKRSHFPPKPNSTEKKKKEKQPPHSSQIRILPCIPHEGLIISE